MNERSRLRGILGAKQACLVGRDHEPMHSSIGADMKNFLAIAILFMATPAAIAGSVDSCPTLPSDSTLQWTYQEGPDFGVCYASPIGAETSVFGMYLGNHPSFHPERSTRIGKGKVGGQRINWYRQEASDDDSPFARQALLVLDKKSGNVAHVWVTAENEQELQTRLAILERLVFKQ